MLRRRTRCFARLAAVSIVAVFLTGPDIAFSQNATATLSGTVVDETGGVVPDVEIVAVNRATQVQRQTRSSPQGVFSLPLLPPGAYTVTARRDGFAPLEVPELVLNVNDQVSIHLQLKVSAVGESVAVTATPPRVETSPAVALVIDQQLVQNLPVSGRRWEDFILLTPGVNADGGFGLVGYRGVSGIYNNNMVDGADNNQAFSSDSRGGTRLQYVYSQNAIQEFQSATSNYSAEFGRAAGGVVNAVTKSGSNTMRGDAFYFVRDSAWLAEDPIAKAQGQPKPDELRQQFGGSFGGPIRRDKLFFFANYDQQVHDNPIIVLPARPDFFDSCDAVAYPDQCRGAVYNPGGPPGFLQSLTGVRPRKRNQNVFLAKVDWNMNAANRLSGVFNLLNWRSPNGIYTNPVVSTAAEAQGFDGVRNEFLTLTWLTTRTNAVNELRFQYGRDFEFERANNGPPVTIIDGGLDFGMHLFLNRPAFPNEKRYQVVDSFSYVTGRHSLKAGIDINHVRDEIINLFQGGGFYLYTPNFGQSAATNFALDFYNPGGHRYLFFTQNVDPFTGIGEGRFSTTDFNAYVQDSIQLTPNLQLQAGLRYELQRMPDIPRPNPAIPGNGSLNTDANNFGPRVGASYSIDDRSILRGGYGLYFGRTSNSSIFTAMFQNGVSIQNYFFLFFDCGPSWPNLAFPAPSTSPTGPSAPGAPPTGVESPGCPVTGSGGVSNALAADFESPMVHQADFTYERELGRDWRVSATYMFSRARNLPVFTDTNIAPTTETVTYGVTDASGRVVQTFTEPSYTSRINPAAGVILTGQSVIGARYNGLALAVNKRMSRGFQLTAHYTIADARDDGHARGDVGTFAGSIEVADPYNLAREHGRANLDVRHTFAAAGVYSIPWEAEGKAGRWFVNDWTRERRLPRPQRLSG